MPQSLASVVINSFMYDYLGMDGWEMNVQPPFTEERTMTQSQPEADGLDAEWCCYERPHPEAEASDLTPMNSSSRNPCARDVSKTSCFLLQFPIVLVLQPVEECQPDPMPAVPGITNISYTVVSQSSKLVTKVSHSTDILVF